MVLKGRDHRRDGRRRGASWLGTPWHRNASLKGVGADCVGVVAGTALALGLPVRYRSDYPQRPDGSLTRELARNARSSSGARSAACC
jgi:hypothetical protein